jgi:hypothetical protein
MMKPRHLIRIVVAGTLLAVLLAGCSLLGFVSIDERMAQFQDDLNSVDRLTLYNNFHPDLTADYAALKVPSLTIDTLIPLRATTDPLYALAVTDQASPSTGVLVTITGGPASYGAPKYLKLVMETSGIGDYRIVSLQQSSITTFTGTPQFN